MSPELRSELLRVLDRYVVGVAEPADMIGVADKVLIDGTYTPSLGELTYLRDRGMESVGPVFESAIRELDISVPNVNEAAISVVRDCASQIVRTPERAHEYVVMIRELETFSDMEVDAGALAYMSWIFEGSEDLFDEQGKLVEEESEWSHLAQHYALTYAQEWLDGHPEERKS
jgi:hypothetical protein